MRIKAGNQLSEDAEVLDLGSSFSITESDRHVTASLGGSITPVVNVKDHGAKGDGVTDDTSAVNAAIAVLATASGDTGSGILYFPAGTYVVSGITIVSSTRVHVMGAGAGNSTLYLKNGANADVLTLAARTGSSDGWFHEVSNLGIDGNKANNSTGNGITVLTTRTSVHHCYIANCPQDGLHVDGASFALSSSANEYHHLWLIQNGQHGLFIGANAFDPFLTDILSYLNGGDGINAATTNISAKGIHVANNSGHGISLIGTSAGYGLWEAVYSHLNTLRGVSITGTGETGHRFGNCQFIGNSAGGVYIANTNGRTGLFASVIKDNNGPGVEIASCNFNILNGCQFFDFQTPKTQTYGVVSTGTADYQTITDCICRAADHLTGATNLVGTHNTLEGNTSIPGSLQDRVDFNDGFKVKTKAGAPTDADFATTPPDGTMAVDTNAGQIYVRLGGGTWKSGPVMTSAKYSTKTGAYTMSSNDIMVGANATGGAFQVTLPSAAGVAGRSYTIKKIDSSANAVTIGTTSAQTIDGASTFSLAAQWKYVTVVSDGSNWLVVANN